MHFKHPIVAPASFVAVINPRQMWNEEQMA
jgi:hypothetical protein